MYLSVIFIYITICNSDYTIVTVMKKSNKHYLRHVVLKICLTILKLEKVITNKNLF